MHRPPYEVLLLCTGNSARSTLAERLLEPILINRPFVVTDRGVRLCRPSERVFDILPHPQRGVFTKQDGDRVVDKAGRRVTPAGAAQSAAGAAA